MIKEGQHAPDFSLPDEAGKQHSLAQLLSQGPVLLYFYPADFTPVCTAQACALRDVVNDAKQSSGPDTELASQPGVQVVGISTQGGDSHRRFKAQYELPFLLLSDESKSAVRAYGVNGPLGFGVRRATFLINEQQLVQRRVVSDFFVGPHAELLRKEG